MPKKRAREQLSNDAATRMAERIGQALARVVNQLESLDAEREKAYRQLVELQDRLNRQVARVGRAIGPTVRTVGGSRTRGRSATKRRRAAKPHSKPTKTAATKRGRTKKRITCGVCGTSGHNARGHAKWQASRGKS
jgi:hypothetical protein